MERRDQPYMMETKINGQGEEKIKSDLPSDLSREFKWSVFCSFLGGTPKKGLDNQQTPDF